MQRRLGLSRVIVGAACAALVASFTGCSSSTAATPADAGPEASSGDASPGSDSSTSDAAGGSTQCMNTAFAGCTTFEDRTADAADRTVTFMDFAYTPKCVRIKAGQSLLFKGDFDRHPLVTSCGPTLAFDHRTGTTPASFVLPAAGRYGYYCLDHGNAAGEVMSGTVDVVP